LRRARCSIVGTEGLFDAPHFAVLYRRPVAHRLRVRERRARRWELGRRWLGVGVLDDLEHLVELGRGRRRELVLEQRKLDRHVDLELGRGRRRELVLEQRQRRGRRHELVIDQQQRRGRRLLVELRRGRR
jgi:hypothetical protein